MFKVIFKNLREKNNLTQKEVAQHLGVSDRSVGYYENGQRVPPIDILEKIADFFNVTTDYLLGRNGDNITSVHSKSETVKKYNTLSKTSDKNQEDLKMLLHNTKNLTPAQIKSINALIEAFNNRE